MAYYRPLVVMVKGSGQVVPPTPPKADVHLG